jgi:hypothetical protein
MLHFGRSKGAHTWWHHTISACFLEYDTLHGLHHEYRGAEGTIPSQSIVTPATCGGEGVYVARFQESV